MKVKITADERLVITAENELEAFALKTWHGRYRNRKSARLEMDIPSEFLDHEKIMRWLDQAGRHLPEFKKWLDIHKPDIGKQLVLDK